MLSAPVWLIHINIGLKHYKTDISTVTSEPMEFLMQFMTLDITVE